MANEWVSEEDAQIAVDQVVDNALIRERIGGRSGQRRVFRAELDGRSVAVKILRPWPADLSDQAYRVLEYSRREVDAMMQCASPHIAQVVAVDDVELPGHQRSVCQIEEFIDGETLRHLIDERMRSGACFPASDLAPIATGVARAIGAMWAHRYVHRDIKPDNIIICDEGRHAVVVDLGICLSLELTRVTSAGQESPHTPGYQSPEQVHGEARLDHRSDQFLLGTSLYEAASGRHPFRTSQVPEDIRTSILHDEPAPLTPAPGVTPAMIRAVDRLLEKNRTLRYPTPERLLADLSQRGE